MSASPPRSKACVELGPSRPFRGSYPFIHAFLGVLNLFVKVFVGGSILVVEVFVEGSILFVKVFLGESILFGKAFVRGCYPFLRLVQRSGSFKGFCRWSCPLLKACVEFLLLD